MSKELLEILCSELKIVRVICRNPITTAPDGSRTEKCGAVIEVPIEKLGFVTVCPICKNDMRTMINPSEDPFVLLNKALMSLPKNRFAEVAFVIPGEAEKPKT